MALKRDVIGDIVLADDKYYVAVVSEMKDYLINEVRTENIRFFIRGKREY
ncbi:MAG: YlmH/Sll1252 family protein [Clostridium sp.]|nr:MAG: YlmH/Sll1252 family protein [Clostridium sp.]